MPTDNLIRDVLSPGGLTLLGSLFAFLTFIAVQAWRIARYTQRTERAIEQMWTRQEQTKFAYELERRNEGLRVPIPDETPRPRWPRQEQAQAATD